MSAQPQSPSAATDAFLIGRLGRQLPHGVLLIASRDHSCDGLVCLQDLEVVRVSADDLPDALPASRRFSAGVVVDALGSLSPEEGGRLLARLRDQLCDRVFVVSRADDTEWPTAKMLALTYTLRERSAEGTWLLYDHDIATYNPERDWNNPTDWANPENFNRYRW